MKLLLLRCPRCGQPLAPGNDDVVTPCANCRAAVAIDDGGPRLLTVQYAAPSQPAEEWLPFWVYQGRVTIRSRKTQGGRSAEKDALAFWGQPRPVYIPAWGWTLAAARDLIRDLLLRQPPLAEVPPPEGALFTPAVLRPEDGRKLLELVIVSIEAGRNDWLESLDYDLRLDSEALWLLPAERGPQGWSLLLKGM